MKIAGRLRFWLILIPVLWPLVALPQVYPVPILSTTQAVAAVTSGDFDPVHPGEELACLMADGSVVELAFGAAGWSTNSIFKPKAALPVPWGDPRMRVSLNVGDVLPGNPGRELVRSFGQLVVAIYYTALEGWTNQVIADFSPFIGTSWGAEAGDCDPAHAGEEVFTIYEGILDFSVGTVHSTTNAGWNQNHVYSGEVGMDAVIGDSNPDVAGNEIIVVTEMGPAYEIMPPVPGGPGPWPKRVIWDDFENAGWVVKIGEVDPESPGNELVYGTRYSDRIMMSRYNETNLHEVSLLFTGVNTNELNNMLDVAIGQLFPTSPSAELLGVDASGSVYVVQQATNQWQGSVLWRDTNALYAVAAANLMPFPGDEVVVAGAGGKVTLLCHPAPGLSLAFTAENKPVLTWDGVMGISYAIETTTNVVSASSWNQLTNVVFEGGFFGPMSYTNAQPDAAHQRFFRIKASW